MKFEIAEPAQKYMNNCDVPTEEEIKAIDNARNSIAKEGTVPFDSIDWD